MSSFDFDPHAVCFNCLVRECDSTNRCADCISWDDELIGRYGKRQRMLQRKRRSRAKFREQHMASGVSTTISSLRIKASSLMSDSAAQELVQPEDSVSQASAFTSKMYAKMYNHLSQPLASQIQHWGSVMDPLMGFLKGQGFAMPGSLGEQVSLPSPAAVPVPISEKVLVSVPGSASASVPVSVPSSVPVPSSSPF